MANYTLIARINAGDGKFPFVSVQFSKHHRPLPSSKRRRQAHAHQNFRLKPS